jgi:hypothetical protein
LLIILLVKKNNSETRRILLKKERIRNRKIRRLIKKINKPLRNTYYYVTSNNLWRYDRNENEDS